MYLGINKDKHNLVTKNSFLRGKACTFPFPFPRIPLIFSYSIPNTLLRDLFPVCNDFFPLWVLWNLRFEVFLKLILNFTMVIQIRTHLGKYRLKRRHITSRISKYLWATRNFSHVESQSMYQGNQTNFRVGVSKWLCKLPKYKNNN